MLKKNFPENKIYIFLAASVIIAVLFAALFFYKPSFMLSKIFHYNINNPQKVDNIFYKQLALLFVIDIVVILGMLLYKSRIWIILKNAFFKITNFITGFLGINSLLVITLIYMAVLFPLAIAHYDLGYDEAVYLEYAKNFANTAVVYITFNEKIILIDTIAMLPYYAASLPNFWFHLTDIWQLKTTAVILSVIALAGLFALSKKHYGKQIAVLFIFFVSVQPGFGFIASSYFGELFQAVFLIYGFYICFSDELSLLKNNRLLLSALYISLAVHTKFQLSFIVTLTLLALYLSSGKKGILKLLGLTVLLSAAISFLRTIPVLITDYSLLRRLILITDIFAGPAYASVGIILDKIQLFNRFFPIPLFLIISAAFYFYSKNLFEKALFYFSLITIAWWIFLYPLTTYRNPFMGIITLSLMAAVLSVRIYRFYIEKYPQKIKTVKYISAASVLFFMAYGFSANIIYAYIGYNDGVQFDLDGFKNRLFGNIVHNTSQKDFYYGVKQYLDKGDTVYNGTWVAQYYLDNPVCTFDKLKESLESTTGEKYLIVTRDFYPLGFEKIYGQIDSLGVTKRLIFKTDKHELYGVKK